MELGAAGNDVCGVRVPCAVLFRDYVSEDGSVRMSERGSIEIESAVELFPS